MQILIKWNINLLKFFRELNNHVRIVQKLVNLTWEFWMSVKFFVTDQVEPFVSLYKNACRFLSCNLPIACLFILFVCLFEFFRLFLQMRKFKN